MIVSTSRGFIFCHLHKTAGESITAALEPHLAWNDVVLGTTKIGIAVDQIYRRRFGLWKHSAAAEIRGVVGEEVWERSFTFSFVRHPFERAQSLYLYMGTLWRKFRGDTLRCRWQYIRRDRTVGPWTWPIMQAYMESRSFSDFIRHPGFYASPAAWSQWALLSDNSRLLVDFVGRFETLDEDFSHVAERVGLPDLRLPHVNRSKRSQPVPLSDDDHALLTELYAVDLERFGYQAGRLQRVAPQEVHPALA